MSNDPKDTVVNYSKLTKNRELTDEQSDRKVYIDRVIDDLGKVGIPKEIRRALGWKIDDTIQFCVDGDSVILRKRIETEGDRLRSMTDEELANYHDELGICPPVDYCYRHNSDRSECKKCWLRFLLLPRRKR